MEKLRNVLDIKRDKNLNFILPLSYSTDKAAAELSETIVVAHLYYEKDLDYYLDYIINIPQEVFVLFTVSSDAMKQKLDNFLEEKHPNGKVIYKENRGRDISALLVAARPYILRYKYVCFVHDKGLLTGDDAEDVRTFAECLWHNMLGGKEYVCNILRLLENRSDLGLLLPPESISAKRNFIWDDTWYINFDNTKELAEKIGLKCNLDPSKKPISLGTVFWAKVDAVRKLLEREWRYEDFLPEPLPLDGTLSHAIERILPFAAQDAGFDTGIVMSDRYAGKRVEIYQKVIAETFEVLREEFQIWDLGMLESWLLDKRLLELAMNKKLHIYGAGKIGKRCLQFLMEKQCSVESFIVSDICGNEPEIDGIPVQELSAFQFRQDDMVLIGVGSRYRDEVYSALRAAGVPKEGILACGRYLSRRLEKYVLPESTEGGRDRA